MRRTFTTSLKIVLVVFLVALLANLLHARDHIDAQQNKWGQSKNLIVPLLDNTNH